MFFKDLNLGFADARREYIALKGSFFKKTFVDNSNIIDSLLNTYSFLLCGSKGVGKTAVISKLRSLSEQDPNLLVDAEDLLDFPYSTFSKTNTSSDTNGTQKYKQSWDFLIYTSLLRVLFERLPEKDIPKDFYKISNLLENINVDIRKSTSKNEITSHSFFSDVSASLKSLKKFSFSVEAIGALDIELGNNSGITPGNYLDRINMLNNLLVNCIARFVLNGKKIFLTIDGLDDVLRFKINQQDIIASLIRSAANVNDTFLEQGIDIKVVLSARSDLLGIINDPDLNKIYQDGRIDINWSNNNEDLKKVLELRFSYSGYSRDNLFNLWYEFFPQKIHEKDSWSYLLERTLRKPRDVIQFLATCKKMYPNKQHLDYKDFMSAIKSFGSDYLMNEMQNELSGFIEQQYITVLPTIFQSLGSYEFSNAKFSQKLNEQNIKGISDNKIKQLLLMLFERSYVGQIITSKGMHNKEFTNVIFKNRNPNNSIDYHKGFITHRGILQGLGVRFN